MTAVGRDDDDDDVDDDGELVTAAGIGFPAPPGPASIQSIKT